MIPHSQFDRAAALWRSEKSALEATIARIERRLHRAETAAADDGLLMVLAAIREVTGLHTCARDDLPAEISALIVSGAEGQAIKPLPGSKWVLVPEDAPVMVKKGEAA